MKDEFLIEPIVIKTIGDNVEEFGDIKIKDNDNPIGIYFFKKIGNTVFESGLHFFDGKIISNIKNTPQQLIDNINYG